MNTSLLATLLVALSSPVAMAGVLPTHNAGGPYAPESCASPAHLARVNGVGRYMAPGAGAAVIISAMTQVEPFGIIRFRVTPSEAAQYELDSTGSVAVICTERINPESVIKPETTR